MSELWQWVDYGNEWIMAMSELWQWVNYGNEWIMAMSTFFVCVNFSVREQKWLGSACYTRLLYCRLEYRVAVLMGGIQPKLVCSQAEQHSSHTGKHYHNSHDDDEDGNDDDSQ
jgi:hypothetical protein